MQYVQTAVLYLVPLILSLAVHEYAHAWAASQLGDDTARMMGRLTLNPVAHMDPFGSLIVPIAFIAMTGRPGFAWAKPVPFNATRFTRGVTMRNGAMLVAVAGPLSNLLLLVVSALLVRASMYGAWMPAPLMALLQAMMPLNAGLFIFNLLPFPPLDGHFILAGFLPHGLAARWEAFSAQFGMFLVWPLMMFGGRVLGPPIGAILHSVYVITGIA